jgi:GNAT superfamily N-acetyltransferase
VDVEVARVGVTPSCPPSCAAHVEREYGADSFYNKHRELSVVDLPALGSRTSRYNSRRCERLGYSHRIIDRSEWEDDLHELRASAPARQGRAMPAAYLERQSYPPEPWPECLLHMSVVHGVVGGDGHLRAYAQVVRSGDMARFNTILAHDAHMRDGVAWLLVSSLLDWHAERGSTMAMYYTHDSGHGDGLRYFKERFGFRAAIMEWA